MLLRSTLAAALCLSLIGATGAEAKSGNCPPGLARKAVPCVPPGQVGKRGGSDGHDSGFGNGDGHDDGHDHWHEYHAGDRLPGDVRYILIPDYQRYGLTPPAPGSEYLRIGDQFYRVGSETRQIFELMQVLGGLLN